MRTSAAPERRRILALLMERLLKSLLGRRRLSLMERMGRVPFISI
jgi:hypothetical protein